MTGERVSIGKSGRVVEVNFEVGSRVREGDVLIRLDAERIDNERNIRQRTIAASQADLQELDKQQRHLAQKLELDRAKAEQEIEQAVREVQQSRARQQAEVAVAEAELHKAEYEEAQSRRLVAGRAAATSDLVKAAAQTRTAQANLAKARLPVDDSKIHILRKAREQLAQEYELKKSELEMKRETRQRDVDTAKAELANLELERKETVIYAHTDGVVTTGEVRVGDVLDAGKAALAIAQERGFRVDVAVPSSEIGHLQEGMPVRVRLDAYDFQRYGTVAGTVVHVSPDSQRLNKDGPDGSLIYVVKVALEGDSVGRGDFHGRIKIGMAGQAEIVTGRESLLALLVKKVRQSISLN